MKEDLQLIHFLKILNHISSKKTVKNMVVNGRLCSSV